LTAMEMRAEWQRLEWYFVRAHRYLILPLIPILFVLVVWAHEIFRLWIGPEFARQATLPFRVLLVGAGVALMAPLSGVLLEAIGRPDLIARLYLAELPLNLLAVFLFTRAYGIVGAAVSYTLRALLETGVLWVLLFRALPLSSRRFFGEGLLPATIPVGVLAAAAWWLGDARLQSPTAWIGTTAALAGYAAAVPLFLLDDRDRRFLGTLPGGGGLLVLTVRAFQLSRALRRGLARWGLAELPVLRGVARRVRRRWFEGSYVDEAAVVTVRVEGLRLALPGRFLPHFVFQEYEPVTKQAVRALLRPGMTVIDVGAHIGYYSILAGKLVGETGRVHAVEPAAENRELLRRNIDLNRVRSVTLHPHAAGRERGRRAFHLTGSSDSHGFYPHPLTKTVRTIEIDVVPLDEVVHGPVHLVKIDVEGSEIEVLRGMRRILAENPGVALGIEWNPACMRSAGIDPLELPRVLQELGFGQIDVLDDYGRRTRTLDEVLPRVRTGEVPHSWYVNLWARR
jgi:FkbM family methyltransferase